MQFATGTKIRDFELISIIGSGGMGEVWLAEEAILGRKVAIKLLNPVLTKEEHFKQRFVNEAKIQASLQHPNIVGLYSFFEQDENYYMALEYADGKTLKDIIAVTGPIPETRVKKILLQILNALQYAHGKGIIHRDIKPSNVMVDANDNIKIMDFGIARIMGDSHLTQTGLKVGTLYYMSPEQILTPKEVDYRTDIYSTGIVLYEMLTGQLPFKTDTESDFVIQKEIVDNQLPDPKSYYPHISDAMIILLKQITEKDKMKRPPIDDVLAGISEHYQNDATNQAPLSNRDKAKEVKIGKNVWSEIDGALIKKDLNNKALMSFELSKIESVGFCSSTIVTKILFFVTWFILSFCLSIFLTAFCAVLASTLLHLIIPANEFVLIILAVLCFLFAWRVSFLLKRKYLFISYQGHKKRIERYVKKDKHKNILIDQLMNMITLWLQAR